MFVTMSRDIAARLYKAIQALRPTWHDPNDQHGAMKVVVTGTIDDEESLRSHARTKAARKRLAERFKNPDDNLRLVIVCDMWLTGFDCPPAHTMYLDKPLANAQPYASDSSRQPGLWREAGRPDCGFARPD